MPSREREQHTYRLPGGQRAHVEKKIFPVGFIPNSWSEMNEVIVAQFHDNPEMLTFYKENKTFYRSFFNARFDVAQKRGSERYNRFLSKYTNEDSRYYKEERFTVGKPILNRINLSLFPNRVLVRR